MITVLRDLTPPTRHYRRIQTPSLSVLKKLFNSPPVRRVADTTSAAKHEDSGTLLPTPFAALLCFISWTPGPSWGRDNLRRFPPAATREFPSVVEKHDCHVAGSAALRFSDPPPVSRCSGRILFFSDFSPRHAASPQSGPGNFFGAWCNL